MSEPGSVGVVSITVSDTRTEADDEGGRVLSDELERAGFRVLRRHIVRDDEEPLQALVRACAEAGDVDAVVLTGGTGVAPRDRTPEALAPLFDKRIDGFGEAFRRLSWAEVGARAMLSRAVAGTVGRMFVFALPGSPTGVRLGVRELVAPLLVHAIAMIRGEAGHHEHHHGARLGDPS